MTDQFWAGRSAEHCCSGNSSESNCFRIQFFKPQ